MTFVLLLLLRYAHGAPFASIDAWSGGVKVESPVTLEVGETLEFTSFYGCSTENPCTFEFKFGDSSQIVLHTSPSLARVAKTFNSPGTFVCNVTLTVGGESNVNVDNIYVTVLVKPTGTLVASATETTLGASITLTGTLVSAGAWPHVFRFFHGSPRRAITDVTANTTTAVATVVLSTATFGVYAPGVAPLSMSITESGGGQSDLVFINVTINAWPNATAAVAPAEVMAEENVSLRAINIIGGLPPFRCVWSLYDSSGIRVLSSVATQTSSARNITAAYTVPESLLGGSSVGLDFTASLVVTESAGVSETIRSDVFRVNPVLSASVAHCGSSTVSALCEWSASSVLGGQPGPRTFTWTLVNAGGLTVGTVAAISPDASVAVNYTVDASVLGAAASAMFRVDLVITDALGYSSPVLSTPSDLQLFAVPLAKIELAANVSSVTVPISFVVSHLSGGQSSYSVVVSTVDTGSSTVLDPAVASSGLFAFTFTGSVVFDDSTVPSGSRRVHLACVITDRNGVAAVFQSEVMTIHARPSIAPGDMQFSAPETMAGYPVVVSASNINDGVPPYTFDWVLVQASSGVHVLPLVGNSASETATVSQALLGGASELSLDASVTITDSLGAVSETVRSSGVLKVNSEFDVTLEYPNMTTLSLPIDVTAVFASLANGANGPREVAWEILSEDSSVTVDTHPSTVSSSLTASTAYSFRSSDLTGGLATNFRVRGIVTDTLGFSTQVIGHVITVLPAPVVTLLLPVGSATVNTTLSVSLETVGGMPVQHSYTLYVKDGSGAVIDAAPVVGETPVVAAGPGVTTTTWHVLESYVAGSTESLSLCCSVVDALGSALDDACATTLAVPLPVLSLAAVTESYEGDAIALASSVANGSPSYVYEWRVLQNAVAVQTIPSVASAAASATTSFVPLASLVSPPFTTFVVEARLADAFSQTSVDSVAIQVFPTIVINISAPSEITVGAELHFNVHLTAGDGGPYTIVTEITHAAVALAGFTNSTSATVLLSHVFPSSPGGSAVPETVTISVAATDAHGWTSAAAALLVVNPVPVVTITSTATRATGESLAPLATADAVHGSGVLGLVWTIHSTSFAQLSARTLTTSPGDPLMIALTPSEVASAGSPPAILLRVVAQDTYGVTSAAVFSAPIAIAEPLVMTLSVSAVEATVGTTVAVATNASGGWGPYLFSLSANNASFASGNTSAVFVGHLATAGASGNLEIIAVATDSSGASASSAVSVAVYSYPMLALSPSSNETTAGVPVLMSAVIVAPGAPGDVVFQWKVIENGVAIVSVEGGSTYSAMLPNAGSNYTIQVQGTDRLNATSAPALLANSLTVHPWPAPGSVTVELVTSGRGNVAGSITVGAAIGGTGELLIEAVVFALQGFFENITVTQVASGSAGVIPVSFVVPPASEDIAVAVGVVVRDAVGATSTPVYSTSIVQASPAVSVTVLTPEVYGGQNASLSISVNGSGAPFVTTVTWNLSDVTALLTPLASITVTSGGGVVFVELPAPVVGSSEGVLAWPIVTTVDSRGLETTISASQATSFTPGWMSATVGSPDSVAVGDNVTTSINITGEGVLFPFSITWSLYSSSGDVLSANVANMSTMAWRESMTFLAPSLSPASVRRRLLAETSVFVGAEASDASGVSTGVVLAAAPMSLVASEVVGAVLLPEEASEDSLGGGWIVLIVLLVLCALCVLVSLLLLWRKHEDAKDEEKTDAEPLVGSDSDDNKKLQSSDGGVLTHGSAYTDADSDAVFTDEEGWGGGGGGHGTDIEADGKTRKGHGSSGTSSYSHWSGTESDLNDRFVPYQVAGPMVEHESESIFTLDREYGAGAPGRHYRSDATPMKGKKGLPSRGPNIGPRPSPVFYVDKDGGDDRNTGVKDQPFRTVNACFEAAQIAEQEFGSYRPLSHDSHRRRHTSHRSRRGAMSTDAPGTYTLKTDGPVNGSAAEMLQSKRVYHVDAVNGDDDGPGTLERPFKTVAVAMAAQQRDAMDPSNDLPLRPDRRHEPGMWTLGSLEEVEQDQPTNAFHSFRSAGMPPPPLPADAHGYYVDAGCGDDDNDGTKERPFRTVAAAVAASHKATREAGAARPAALRIYLPDPAVANQVFEEWSSDDTNSIDGATVVGSTPVVAMFSQATEVRVMQRFDGRWREHELPCERGEVLLVSKNQTPFVEFYLWCERQKHPGDASNALLGRSGRVRGMVPTDHVQAVTALESWVEVTPKKGRSRSPDSDVSSVAEQPRRHMGAATTSEWPSEMPSSSDDRGSAHGGEVTGGSVADDEQISFGWSESSRGTHASRGHQNNGKPANASDSGLLSDFSDTS